MSRVVSMFDGDEIDVASPFTPQKASVDAVGAAARGFGAADPRLHPRSQGFQTRPPGPPLWSFRPARSHLSRPFRGPFRAFSGHRSAISGHWASKSAKGVQDGSLPRCPRLSSVKAVPPNGCVCTPTHDPPPLLFALRGPPPRPSRCTPLGMLGARCGGRHPLPGT